MADGFRVQTIEIEGFKGFTTPKVIDFQSLHVFLLGKNGNGKSSIVEAIRWGLFGSTGRPNEIVANRGYSGSCRVVITLIRGAKHWRLQRTLIRGVSGGSDAILTDEDGQEQSIRGIMPQLDSADTGEGTYIIFAPQATPLRRQPEDLTPFERTVFNHLGLTHPRALLSHVNNFLADQSFIESTLADKLTDARDEINSGIAEFERHRRIILNSPPWDSRRPPSIVESENKARILIEDISGSPLDQSLSGVSLAALINSAEEALTERRARSGLESELAQITRQKNQLLKLRNLQEQIKSLQSLAQDVQSQLDTILDGKSIYELKSSVDLARATANTEVLRRRMAEYASSLIDRDLSESVGCPVCETMHDRDDLTSVLQRIKQLSEDSSQDLEQLRARLTEAEKFETTSRVHKNSLAILELNSDIIKKNIPETDLNELNKQADTDHICVMITRYSELEISIKSQIDSQEGWSNKIRARLSNLKEESRFHRIQTNLTDLQKSKNQFGQVQAAYQNLVSFGESVRTISRAVETYLSKQLKADIPRVSEDLSQVFSALTRHPWFDRLIMAEDRLPKLVLRVASSQDPHGIGHPTGVLNGQAESALDLVPYFAFGQADDAPTEVYLVMLDDPTRAFDEDHTEILIERLAGLGQNVQLMVASQETFRFRKLLPKNFDRSSYVVIEPTDWSYDGGPELKIEYE